MALAITLLDDNQRRVLQRAERIFKAPGEVREWSRAASERATRFQCATGQLYALGSFFFELGENHELLFDTVFNQIGQDYAAIDRGIIESLGARVLTPEEARKKLKLKKHTR